MRNLRDLVEVENADSALSFRERAYGKGEQVELLCDVTALANAATTGTRFLCLGVSDNPNRKRTFPGVSRRAWNWAKEILPRLIEQAIEPQLRISMVEVTLGEALIGVICLDACHDQPFLFRGRVSSLISPGSGWIRCGIKQRPSTPVVRLWNGIIAVPLVGTLDSARTQLVMEKMLDARRLSKAVLGRTDTHIARLVHAQVSSEAQVYQSHGTTTMKKMLRQIPKEHASADEHYQFEIRTHKLNLLVGNLTDMALSDVLLVLKIPRVEGVGVVEKLHAAPGKQTSLQERYPVVDVGPQAVTVQASRCGCICANRSWERRFQ